MIDKNLEIYLKDRLPGIVNSKLITNYELIFDILDNKIKIKYTFVTKIHDTFDDSERMLKRNDDLDYYVIIKNLTNTFWWNNSEMLCKNYKEIYKFILKNLSENKDFNDLYNNYIRECKLNKINK